MWEWKVLIPIRKQAFPVYNWIAFYANQDMKLTVEKAFGLEEIGNWKMDEKMNTYCRLKILVHWKIVILNTFYSFFFLWCI